MGAVTTNEIKQVKATTKAPFYLLYLLWFFISFKPEWTIPGLKFIAPAITVLHLILFLAWLSVANKKVDHPITKYFFFFLILMIVSSLFARNNGLPRDTIRGMFFLFIIYLATITFADNQRKVHSIFNVFILGSAFIAIISIREGGSAKGVTVFSDENDLALAMNILLPLTIFLALGEKNKLKKIFYSVLSVIFLTSIVVSGSRGGIVGLVAVLFFIWLKLPFNKLKSAFIVLMVIIGLGLFAPKGFWGEASQILEGTQESTGTGAARLFFWKVAFNMYLDNPILGVGVNNFGVWLPEYTETKVAVTDERISGVSRAWGRVCHSLYFTLLSELGSVGAVLFTIILYRFFKELRFDKRLIRILPDSSERQRQLKMTADSTNQELQTYHALRMGLFCGMIGFLASGTFLTVLYYPQFWLMCSLAVMLGNYKKKVLMNQIVSNQKPAFLGDQQFA